MDDYRNALAWFKSSVGKKSCTNRKFHTGKQTNKHVGCRQHFGCLEICKGSLKSIWSLWKWKGKNSTDGCSTMIRVSNHGEYLDATPLGYCWLQDARPEAISEKEDEWIQKHNDAGKSRKGTASWGKTRDEDVDNACGTSTDLDCNNCPSSLLDVHHL